MPRPAHPSAAWTGVHARRKTSDGEHVDKPNYFSVTVWGGAGENCARFLSKGRPVALDGRLEWREWQGQDGAKRESVEIVADSVQFLGSPDDAATSDTPEDEPDLEPVPAGVADGDDIPFEAKLAGRQTGVLRAHRRCSELYVITIKGGRANGKALPYVNRKGTWLYEWPEK